VIVQGVYELFEKEPSTEWADEQRINRLVFIGEHLLQSCTCTMSCDMSV
jgi:G3E family GTPase